MGIVRSIPPLRWAILIVDFDPVVGHEQGGERRCLVVSYEPFHRSRRVTICPITAARSEVRYPNEVPIPVGEAGQTKSGVILVHQVRTISLERGVPTLHRNGGRVHYVSAPAIRRQVRQALERHFGLDIPPSSDGMV
ncbi:MAG: type II toxin-antitoxin system PemK/MazF family toxin [Chloroflexota bacterium]